MSSTNSKRILIAEDETSISRALQLKLKGAGYEVDIAHDGTQAIELLSENDYDLLLLDIMMPEKDGFEVLEEIRKTKNNVTVVVSSNLSQDIDKTRAQKLGATDFFVKSNTSLSEIVDKVTNLLNK